MFRTTLEAVGHGMQYDNIYFDTLKEAVEFIKGEVAVADYNALGKVWEPAGLVPAFETKNF